MQAEWKLWKPEGKNSKEDKGYRSVTEDISIKCLERGLNFLKKTFDNSNEIATTYKLVCRNVQ